MQQTKSSTQRAPPVIEKEAERSSESKPNILKAIEAQALQVAALADEYSKTGSQETRKQLNTENMHLHGQIHVFWDAMRGKEGQNPLSEEQRAMENIQKHANSAIEEAAKARGHGATYSHINDLRSASGQTAGQHIHELLIRHDIDTPQKLYGLLEDKVTEGLSDKGLHYPFFERLFEVFHQAPDAGGAQSPADHPPEAAKTAERVPESIPLRGEEKKVDPLAERLSEAERRNADLLDLLKKANGASDKRTEELITALREKTEAIQRELATTKIVTEKTEESNSYLQQILKLEKQMTEIVQKRDATYLLYDETLSDERSRLSKSLSDNAQLESNLMAHALQIERLLKKLAKANKTIKTKTEIQHIYDGKVWRLQKAYSAEAKKVAAANRELEKTKHKLEAAQKELNRLKR